MSPLTSCSAGSMLALDRPFIAKAVDSSLDVHDEICLEYGSATQLYLVPLMLHEEQVRDEKFVNEFIIKMIS